MAYKTLIGCIDVTNDKVTVSGKTAVTIRNIGTTTITIGFNKNGLTWDDSFIMQPDEDFSFTAISDTIIEDFQIDSTGGGVAQYLFTQPKITI